MARSPPTAFDIALYFNSAEAWSLTLEEQWSRIGLGLSAITPPQAGFPFILRSLRYKSPLVGPLDRKAERFQSAPTRGSS